MLIWQIDTYNSNLYSDPSSHNFDTQSLTITKRLNPHDNGLRRYARLRESREKEELKKRKVHTTYSTAASTKVAFGVFLLFDLSSRVTIPKQQTNTDAILTEQVIIRFHKVNELYDGTPNKTLNLFNSTDITTN